MEIVKTTKTFKKGSSQAVTIPDEFRLPEGIVRIEKIGGAILLIPQNNPWGLFDESLKGFSDDFMADGRKQLEMQKTAIMFDE